MENPSSIYFHTEDIKFSLEKAKDVADWVEKSIQLEKKELGEINFIFCSDNYLLKINQDYLKHDTYTDIVTFNYVENNVISGDLFISIERVKENSASLEIEFLTELKRVMIHGVLHLIGYDDKSSAETVKIRAKEDFYLTLHP